MAPLACLSVGSIGLGAALNAGTGFLGATILQSTGGYSHLDKGIVVQASSVSGAFSFPIALTMFLHLRDAVPAHQRIFIAMLCHLLMTMQTCQISTILTQDESVMDHKIVTPMFTGYAALTATAIIGSGLCFFGKRIANALCKPASEPRSDLTINLV